MICKNASIFRDLKLLYASSPTLCAKPLRSPTFARFCRPPARPSLLSVHPQHDIFADLQPIALFVPLHPDKSVHPQPDFAPSD